MIFNLLSGRRPQESQTTKFDERAWKRDNQETWEIQWRLLSAPARFAFMNEVKSIPRYEQQGRRPGREEMKGTSPAKFAPEVLQELVRAGMVTRDASKKVERVLIAESANDFLLRTRYMQRCRLLTADPPDELEKYVKNCFEQAELVRLLNTILGPFDIPHAYRVDDMLKLYVVRPRWFGWVHQSLKNPLAVRLLDAASAAPGPLPLHELLAQGKDGKPAEVRAAYHLLLNHLVLFEGIQANSGELIVGLLPGVRKGLVLAGQKRQRPPLEVCAAPREVGPEDLALSDLRVFLLELASEPPRLKQDRTLFQKEAERIQAAFETIPDWFQKAVHASPANRLVDVFERAVPLRLVEINREGDKERLYLAKAGQRWLASSLEKQFEVICNDLRSFGSVDDDYPRYAPGDARFLGMNVLAFPNKKKRTDHYSPYSIKPEQLEPLRDSLYETFAELPLGDFHTLDSFLAHATFGTHNPLLLGLPLGQSAVYWNGYRVPQLEEELEEAGRNALYAFLTERLIPLGCVRAGWDAQGKLCIARQPRLDRYFDRTSTLLDLPPVTANEAKVIVQPDFSIVIIGLNSAPAAELAPFCERRQGHPSQGALVLKLSREAVLKAVANGLSGEEILARLKRHASNDLPANVLSEVKEWCNWVRQVRLEALTVLRCPDRETADRVLAALKRGGERITDTLVAVPQEVTTAAERNKLRAQGIIVQTGDGQGKTNGRGRTPRY